MTQCQFILDTSNHDRPAIIPAIQTMDSTSVKALKAIASCSRLILSASVGGNYMRRRSHLAAAIP